MQIVETWRLDADEHATEPNFTHRSGGGSWLTWASRDPQEKERIRVAKPGDPPWGEGLEGRSTVVSGLGQACWPSLLASASCAGVVWTESGIDQGVGLWGRALEGSIEGLGDAQVLICAGERLGRPAAAMIGETPTIAFERTIVGEHRIEVAWASGGGWEVATLDASESDLRCRPAIAVWDDRAAVVWEAHAPGRIEIRGAIIYRGGKIEELGTLLRGDGFFQGPSIAWDARGRFWMAVSSDLQDNGPPTLARWVRLFVVTPGTTTRVQETAQKPPGFDLEARGEDQSLEFPSVAIDPKGDVWVAARASHNMRLQRFGAGGWGPLEALEPVLWGCRGIRLSAACTAPGRLQIAYHGRRGIQLADIQATASGPPEDKHLIDRPLPSDLAPLPECGAPVEGFKAQKAFWGDVHFHSAHSDGVGTAEEAYLRCRDRYGLDFACLTDHDAFIGRRVTDGVWRSMVGVAEAFHAPDAGFATLIGIEYTGVRYPGPGHKCVYFDGPEAPLVCRWDGLEAPEALLARVGELGGIAVPHHVGWLGGDPDNHDPIVQPCWEICSTHGQYECEMDDRDPPAFGHRLGLEGDQAALKGHFIRRRLEAGQVFGFVGGSDGHGLMWHHGISRKADSHLTGLTGVWLDGLSRGGIMAAIRSRRTWATSGGRLALAFEMNGAPQGAMIDRPTEGATIAIKFKGTRPWTELAILTQPPGEPTCAVVKLEGDGGSDQIDTIIEVPRERLREDAGFLYIRVTQADGETAWASPCFWR